LNKIFGVQSLPTSKTNWCLGKKETNWELSMHFNNLVEKIQ